MIWPLLFGCLIVAVVVLKYLNPWGERCPQCYTRRVEPEYPLCPECGWIFELPGEEEEDDEEEFPEEETSF